MALIKSGIDDATVGVRGSSVTGISYKTVEPFNAASDIDFFIESAQLTKGLRTSKQIPGMVHPRIINAEFKPVAKWAKTWSANLSRKVSAAGFQPGTVTGEVIIP